MLSDQELLKRTQCKQPRQRARPIGRVLQDYARRSNLRRGEDLANLRVVVGQVLGEEFMARCRVLAVQRGTLIVQVDDPALAYHYRRTCLFSLREHLSRAVPQARISDIQFRIGP